MRSVFKIFVTVVLIAGVLSTGCSKKGTVQPEAALIDSTEYVIGPEDVLKVEVWREKALSETVTVRMDGMISLPLINDIKASGLTALQLQDSVAEKLKEFIDNPQVSVTVTEANSFRVYVSGQVKTPGVHKLRSQITLLQLIPMAGGFTDWANQKKILVIRNEGGKEERFTVNYKKMVDGKVPVLILKKGDTIVIP
jgi:polysaccharide export outer membrane protein